MKIFTIATAHLDTSWLWTQEETIKYLIKPTFEDNFDLMDKYPDYRFNFEGSYRYEMLKEYYPESFEKLKKYVEENRFNVTGSAFENGDVNIVSPEALIRNIMYGNTFFYNEFGKRCSDIYLPDCFGFGKALPGVMTHCGLKGFSTQKLTWGSQNGIPFEIGKWTGLDNKPVYISIDGGTYETILGDDIRKKYQKKLDKNSKYGIDATMVYHGTGDRGGTPHIKSVKALEAAIEKNKDSDIEVISASPAELYDYIEKLDKETSLPVFDDEFLLSTHGVGSYTSRTQTKRFNKRCEVLADICERANTLSYLCGYKYPDQKLDFAWKKVLQHHFHDDITGTSFMESYKRSYNDYVQALNVFESEYKNAVLSISDSFDTSDVSGVPVVVFNPSQDDSAYMASIEIEGLGGRAVKVFNKDKKELSSQVNGNTVYFRDEFKGNTISFYDIQIGDDKYVPTELENTKSIENDRYVVRFDDEYCISGIYDKKLDQEVLKSKIEYELIEDTNSIEWPSWEIKYEDVIKTPYAHPKFKSFKVLDSGDVFTRVEIIKTYKDSEFKEIITLEKGGQRIDVFNEVDWSLEATDLKIRFNTQAENKYASYDIGFGSYKRDNNNAKKYEVPAQRFADITDDEKGFGVSILSDSRTGYDKPDDDIIRLTAIHTPLGNYRYENSQHLQDLGINRFSYSIYSHEAGLETTASEADKFVKGVQAFVIGKHNGSLKELSLVSVNDPCVRISAVKKALEGNDIIVRVNEYTGKECSDVVLKFDRKPVCAYECYGDERIIKEADPSLVFALKPFEIKTFRIRFDEEERPAEQEFAVLDFDKCGITSNQTRNNSTLKNKVSLPKELIDEVVSSCGVDFRISKDTELNAMSCSGQVIKLNSNYRYANILMLNIGRDKEIEINEKTLFVQSSMENLGCWDLVGLNEAGYVKKISQDYTLTHYHDAKEDVIAHNIYLYNIKVPVTNDQVVLPNDDELYIFAITLNNRDTEISTARMFDQLEKRELHYNISEYAMKKSREPKYQKFLDLFTDRRRLHKIILGGGYTTQSLSDAYSIIDEKRNKKDSKSFEREKHE